MNASQQIPVEQRTAAGSNPELIDAPSIMRRYIVKTERIQLPNMEPVEYFTLGTRRLRMSPAGAIRPYHQRAEIKPRRPKLYVLHACTKDDDGDYTWKRFLRDAAYVKLNKIKTGTKAVNQKAIEGSLCEFFEPVFASRAEVFDAIDSDMNRRYEKEATK